MLGARNAAELEAAAEQCRAAGARVVTVSTDVAEERDCQALVSAARLAFGRLDVLVNNAGATMWARFEEVGSLGSLPAIACKLNSQSSTDAPKTPT